MRKLSFLLLAMALVAFVGSSLAQSDATAEEEHAFIGATKCKTCHKKPEVGEQFPLWEKSKHAQAYSTLATDKAKEFAKEKGIDNPQEADACLKCHVTGHGVKAELLGTKYDKTQGVTCESCHGAGGDYYKKKTMVAIMSGEIDGATVGLVMPDEKACTKCHNEESPTFESFDFKEMSKKIAHPIPAEKKAEYEKG
jgi:ribosomal protein L40E